MQLITVVTLLLITTFASTPIFAAKNTTKPNKGDALIVRNIRASADKLFDNKEFEKAIPYYLKMIAMMERVNILSGANLANDYDTLAYCYKETKQYDLAEKFGLKAIAANENELVLEHPGLLAHYGNLGLLYFEIGRKNEAEDYFLKSLREKYGTSGNERLNLDDVYIAIIYEHLADIYAQNQQFEKAQANYALAIEHANKAESFPKLAIERLYNKSTLPLVELGLTDDAVRVLENFLIPEQEELWGEADDRTVASYIQLAILYNIQKNYKSAEELNLKSIAILEKKHGAEYPQLAHSYASLASVDFALGLYDKAEKYYLNAIRLGEKIYGPEDSAFSTWNYDLAGVYVEQGDLEKAKLLLLKAIQIREKSLGEYDANLVWYNTRLARIYHYEKNYVQAEPLFLKAVNIAFKNFGNANENSKSAVENYLACLAAQGKPTAELKMQYGVPAK